MAPGKIDLVVMMSVVLVRVLVLRFACFLACFHAYRRICRAALWRHLVMCPIPSAMGSRGAPPAMQGRVCEMSSTDGGCELGVECVVVSGSSWTGVARYPLQCAPRAASVGEVLTCVRSGGVK